MSKLELKPTLSIGGSGGKKGGHKPIVKEDTIRSTQAIQVIDVLSEGPIKGFSVGRAEDMRKSIYFDDTPVMNPDGTENFRLAGVDARYGEPNQRPLEGFAEVKEHISVGVEVKQKNPNGAVRTLTNTNANRVMVNVAIPSLMEQKDNGDVVEYEVNYDISIQAKGGGFKVVGEYNIKEKVSSLYVKEHIFDLHGEGPWDIRVRRHSEDVKDNRRQNALHFDSMAAIIDSKLNYANTAIVGIAGRASDFSSVPNRAYLIDGLIISVPSNYDPIARTYAGDWDGTFKQEWTNNPAWILYDILTNNRYGLGKYMPPQAQDKWALYEIAQYCDEMVDDGFGGREPRFTLNAYIFNDQEAYNLLQTISSMFSGMVYWGAGTVRVVQDRPRTVEALFTNANVVDGRFTYKGTSLKSRHTVAMVTWYDPEDMYRPKTEYVQDDEAVAKWGIIQTQVVSYGTTSRGQAHRFGRRILYTEQYATETVVFRTGLEGMFLMPGDVFAISDATRSGKRTGGRVVSVEGSTVTLDSEVTFDTSNSYSLSFFNPDGVIVTKDIPTTDKLVTNQLKLDARPDEMPAPGTIWILHTSTFSHKAWQVVSITLIDDTTVEISGLAYRQDKYDAIDKGLKLERLKHSEFNSVPKAPTNVNLLVSNMFADDKIVGLKGLLSWTGDASYYVVRGRYENGDWATVTVDTHPPKVEINNILPGKCYFNITPYSAFDVPGPSVDYSTEVNPPPTTLPDVQNLVLDGAWIGKEAKFKWDPVEGATGYLVKVEQGGQVKRTVKVGDTLRYTYSSTDMRVDGGPFRTFSVSVKATGPWGSASENWTTLNVGNEQASAVVSITVTPGVKVGYLSVTVPAEDDIQGMQVWVGESADLEAIDANLVYDGMVGNITLNRLADYRPLEGGKEYFVRVALYDSYDKIDLKVSTAVSFRPVSTDISPQSITSEMIKDGVLDISKFAKGIEVVTVWPNTETNLPKEKKTSVLLWNGKLYRWTGSSYSKSVGAGDIEANAVTAGTIAVGAVGADQIATQSLSAKHFSVGDFSNIVTNGRFESFQSGWTGDVQYMPRVSHFANKAGGKVTGASGYYGDWFPLEGQQQYWMQFKAVAPGGTVKLGLEVASEVTGPSEILIGPSVSGGSVDVVGAAVATGPNHKYGRIKVWSEPHTSSGYITDIEVRRMTDAVLIQDGAVTGNKIKALSITGDKVLANTLTGDHLAINSVTGDRIKVGSISSDRFTSGLGGGNLVPNAGLVPSAWRPSSPGSITGFQYPDGWGIWNSPSGVLKTTVNSSESPRGGHSVSLTNSSMAPGQKDYFYSDEFPVQGGAWYEVSYKGAATSGHLDGRLAFYDTNGTLMVANTLKGSGKIFRGSGRASKNLNDWVQAFCLEHAPQNAVTARFVFVLENAAQSFGTGAGFVTQPYVGVALSEQQSQPSPWSPSMPGTFIHGGLIRTHTIQAHAISTDKLSAISANLGKVTAGEVTGVKFYNGDFKADAEWPQGNGSGFYLDGYVFRMGNRRQGRFVEMYHNGDVYMPGFEVRSGTVAISQLNVIGKANIARGAVSFHQIARGRNPTVRFTAETDFTFFVRYQGNFDGSSGRFLGLYNGNTLVHKTDFGWVTKRTKVGRDENIVEVHQFIDTVDNTAFGKWNLGGNFELTLRTNNGTLDVFIVYR